jgi:putative DNA primase/helicase
MRTLDYRWSLYMAFVADGDDTEFGGVVNLTPAAALALGLSIIPCGRDKKPQLNKWKEFQTRRPTEQEVAAWQGMDPAIWAMVTGKVSGRITLDFDGEAGRRTLEGLGLEPHRSTPNSGYHCDFQHPGWYVKTLNGKSTHELGRRWPGTDCKGDGGYACIIGRTATGRYKWLRSTEPHRLDVLPEDFRESLGLLRPPHLAPNGTEIGNARMFDGERRVDAELLVRMAVDRVGQSAGRNNSGMWLACQLRDNDYSQIEAEFAMRDYRARVPTLNTKGDREDYTESEMVATLREAYSRRPRAPWDRQKQTSIGKIREASKRESNLLFQPYTDTGNAERLVLLYGRDIHFCGEFRKWLVWDGQRWNSEDTRRVKVLAKRVARSMYAQAAAIEQKEARETAERHARKSESAAAINAMLVCAEYEKGVPISASELDKDPFLLNFLNGTLDLRTGRLREHRQMDLITKVVHFNYRPGAACPRFMRFVHRIMGDGPEGSDPDRARADRMVSYLQKAFGYALTADVSEKAVFCFFGAGNNGKTTLLETVRFVLSEYSSQVLIDSLMTHHSRESNASLADLADLRGARFVTTSEAEEGQRLAVGKLKYLTAGMGEIKTCRKYENPIKFMATHKLFLDANHKPVIRGTDKAVWNRLKPVPFTETIPAEEIDKTLLDKLKAEAEGVLAWMVKGYQRYRKEGLGDPPEVSEASVAWQAESDRFPAFLEEKCLLSPDVWLPVALLWPTYQTWCEENRERYVMPKTSFDERLEQLGCVQGKRNDGTTRVWVGIRFRTANDDRRGNGTTGHSRTPNVDN